MQGGTYFPEVRRMLLFHAPLILTHFWPASTLLRGHLALATLSPPETDVSLLQQCVKLTNHCQTFPAFFQDGLAILSLKADKVS